MICLRVSCLRNSVVCTCTIFPISNFNIKQVCNIALIIWLRITLSITLLFYLAHKFQNVKRKSYFENVIQQWTQYVRIMILFILLKTKCHSIGGYLLQIETQVEQTWLNETGVFKWYMWYNVCIDDAYFEYISFSHIVYGIKVEYQFGKKLWISFEYAIINTCLWYCFKVAPGKPKKKPQIE